MQGKQIDRQRKYSMVYVSCTGGSVCKDSNDLAGIENGVDFRCWRTN